MNTPLSQHPDPRMSLLHISDTHLLGGDRQLWGSIDAAERLTALLERVVASGERPSALVFTGDLADIGEEEAYRTLRRSVEPFAETLGAQIIWVMGNHDEREPFARILFDEDNNGKPLDRVYDIDGLRVIALDTSVPGFHHGELSAGQHEWLRGVLATDAPHGTLVAMHHPPIPTPIDMMGVIELDDQAALWQSIAGSDVRGILAGHLHYSTFSAYQGIPVSVAAAMCYNIDMVAAADALLSGIDAGHSASLVSVYPEQVVFSELVVGDLPVVFTQPKNRLSEFRTWSPEQRRAVFSDKNSDFNKGEQAAQSGG
ncbi:phosphodiesterase [Pontimonas salivibrio]|nr:phosphodiesterase [Pontimonas salivibrio]